MLISCCRASEGDIVVADRRRNVRIWVRFPETGTLGGCSRCVARIDPLCLSASCPQGIIYSVAALTLLFFITRPRHPHLPCFGRYIGTIDPGEPSHFCYTIASWKFGGQVAPPGLPADYGF